MAASGAGHLHSRRLSLVVMMQTPDFWHRDHPTLLRRVNGARDGAIHGQ
jgi:hypothetical protein